MKKIFRLLSIATISAFACTSCIDEVFPEGGTASSDQVGASASALEASLNGIPSQMVQWYYVYGEQVDEIDMGYPMFMLMQTEMLGDIYPLGKEVGYDWFRRFNIQMSMGATKDASYLPWFTLYRFIKSCNDVIASVDVETVPANLKELVGKAYAGRAYFYYMLMTLYEPMENIYTDCSKVKGLTVPIVTEKTTADEAKNNPRVTREAMMEFILSDLNIAEECMAEVKGKAWSNRSLPGLAVAYGVKAKAYLWNEDYANAAKYAELAIQTANVRVMSKAEWVNPKTAFNTACDSWMWYISYPADNMANLCNFMGFASNEAGWGYGMLCEYSIDRKLYDHMNDTDIRKQAFIHPKKMGFHDYEFVSDAWNIESVPACFSLKFRCKEGDCDTYTVGGACDVPVMRVEEMYFILAEAKAASAGLAEGKKVLEDFMKNYRDPGYTCPAADLRSFQEEVLAQMRIEFWGEGVALPNAKRLRVGVMQNYAGTNAPTDDFKINCREIKPSWNLVIPQSEVQSNAALDDMNNPDPTASVKGPLP